MLATLHANSSNQALDRVVNFFPEDRREQLLMDLSLNLRGLISQRLVPREGGKGRIAATEIMLNSPLIADLIFKGEVTKIKEVMARSTRIGMKTFDQSLFDLYETGFISYEDARPWARSIKTKTQSKQMPPWFADGEHGPVATSDLVPMLIAARAANVPVLYRVAANEPVRIMQTNWIGRSEGAEVVFTTAPDDHQPGGDELRVFTTRPDTLYGATFMVLAPEHPLVGRLTAPERKAEVEAYVARARAATEIERLSTEREKTGVALGAFAVNPVNGARIPIWIADYVLASYGTGAIMAVPAHDERDFAFAQRFGDSRLVLAPQKIVVKSGREMAPW